MKTVLASERARIGATPVASLALATSLLAASLFVPVPAGAEVPAAKPLDALAAEVMGFLTADVGAGGIRFDATNPGGQPLPPYFYHYAIRNNNVLWTCGDGYPGYCAVSYPAYTASVAIDAFLDYRRWSGDAVMLDRARRFADWILAHRTPDDALYGNLPYSTQTDGVMGGGWDGPAIMTDKPAMFALRLLRLFDITGETDYRDAALEIADVLAATQLAGDPLDDGRWPFRVVPETGEVTQDYTSHLQPAVRLFDALAERTGDPAYAAVRDRAWDWLLRHPCNPASVHHQRWEAFYEDQSPEMQTGKRDHYSAHEMIVELVKRRPAGWRETALAILDTVDARFLMAGPGTPYQQFEPVTLEWEGWPEATYAASLQYARTVLLLEDALAGHPLADPARRERALAMLDVCTHGQNDVPGADDGRMFTTVRDLLYFFNIDSWYEQNFNTVKYALEIMALVPELAPDGETRVLSADRALTAITYGGTWDVAYATAGGSGRETVRLAGPPSHVRAGETPLPELDAPEDPGPGWFWDATAGVLTVHHSTSPVTIAVDVTAAPGPGHARPLLLATDGDGSARITLRVPEAGAVWLDVHDLRGRLVRRLATGEHLAAGEHAFVWDGRDAAGAPAASGLYLMRARTPAGSASARLVLVR